MLSVLERSHLHGVMSSLGAWAGWGPPATRHPRLKAETPRDPPGQASASTPTSHSPSPDEPAGDGFVHCASCTGHKPLVAPPKVTSTLSLPELSCGVQGGWCHSRFTLWKLFWVPFLTPPTSLPTPALLKAPPSIPLCHQCKQSGFLCQNHTPHRSRQSPLVPAAQVIYSTNVSWALLCVRHCSRQEHSRKQQSKVLPSWKPISQREQK